MTWVTRTAPHFAVSAATTFAGSASIVQLTAALGADPRHPAVSGKKLYEDLKERGILIRHFEKDRIKEFNRITIGTREQMQALIAVLEELL